jgi:hypothetical protein
MAGVMAQAIEHLPSKHEALSTNASTSQLKNSIMEKMDLNNIWKNKCVRKNRHHICLCMYISL